MESTSASAEQEEEFKVVPTKDRCLFTEKGMMLRRCVLNAGHVKDHLLPCWDTAEHGEEGRKVGAILHMQREQELSMIMERGE